MSDIGKRIKARREELGLSQEELAVKAKFASRSSINKIESGNRELTQQRIKDIADALMTTPSYIMGWDEPEELPANVLPIRRRRIPLLGNIACGEPIFADEQYDLFASADEELHADFCLRASGDSMTGARIFDGDIVFIKQQDMVEDGEIAAVLIGDEATLKRVQYNREENEILLFAENPRYKTMRFSGAELDRVRILGKAVAFQSVIK